MRVGVGLVKQIIVRLKRLHTNRTPVAHRGVSRVDMAEFVNEF